jgi:hypothetical protein
VSADAPPPAPCSPTPRAPLRIVDSDVPDHDPDVDDTLVTVTPLSGRSGTRSDAVLGSLRPAGSPVLPGDMPPVAIGSTEEGEAEGQPEAATAS